MASAFAYRLRIFAWHLLASVSVLTLILGLLYFGWYRWPGWYLTGALHVVPILVGVDVALGPLVTLLIASPRKPRAELARDIAIVATVQLVALLYGSATLWHGRPLYYAFSEDRLQIVQASDLDPAEIARARRENPAFAPLWYRRTQWVWAPLPAAPEERTAIMRSAITGGDDVIQMPRYFRSWQSGLPTLRSRLLTLDGQQDLRVHVHRALLRQHMIAAGFPPDEPVTLLTTGRGAPLLAVFDRATLQLRGFVRSEP